MSEGAVSAQIDAARAAADAAFATAQTAIAALGSVTVTPYSLDIEYEDERERVTRFERASFFSNVVPSSYLGNVERFSAPEVPTLTVRDPNPGPAPTFDQTFEPSFPPRPGGTTTNTPPPAPVLDTITLPPEPTPDYGEVPDLLTITDPGEVLITLPTFDASPPTDPLPDFDHDIDFTDERYTSAMLTTLRNQITSALANGTGLPAAIQNALFERQVWIQDREAARARRQALKNAAARGFSRPSGALFKELAEIEKAGVEARSRLGLEQYLERWRQEVEEVREYTRIGIELEARLIQEHIAFYQRKLDFSRLLLETAVQVFNTHIRRYELGIEIFRAKVEQYRAELEAALAPLQKLRAEVDVAQAKANVNQALVARYRAEVEAANGVIALYNAQVEAVAVLVRNNSELVNQYRAQIEAYRADVEAQQLDIQGYAAEVEAELTKARVFETQVNAFASRIQGYRALVDSEVAKTNADVRKGELRIQGYQAEIEKARGIADTQLRKLDAAIAVYRADVEQYSAEIQQQRVEADSSDRRAEMLIQEAKAKAEIAVAAAGVQERATSEASSQLVRAFETLAQVSGSLAASAMNSANASVSLSTANCE